jgi:predicted ferric reductase
MRRGPSIRSSLIGTAWLCAYALLALAPLALILTTPRPTGRDFWTEFSVALGFVGLAMMCLQFALTARFDWLKAPYGSDVVYAFHRAISMVSIGLITAHPAILFVARWDAMRERPFTHPVPFWIGTLAVVCLLWIVVVSVFRAQLKIRYDQWRRAHAILAIVAVAAGVVHVLTVGHYLDQPVQRGLWLAYTLAFVLLVAYVRVIKPLRELRKPWKVDSVTPERGDAVRLVLAPDGHEGLRFAPGQFAWITLWDSPFSDREHPFSFSGSAMDPKGRVEFTIKNLGDWTKHVREATPGQRAFVDGPFGGLSADRYPTARGFAFFAGGIGITPMVSHLRTFADRGGEARPCWLFYAGKDWEGLTLREEVEALRARLPNLKVVYVLGSTPPAGATDAPVEIGFITRELIDRHAPEIAGFAGEAEHVECFICGPVPMMNAVETALRQAGVRLGDYHAERFNLV